MSGIYPEDYFKFTPALYAGFKEKERPVFYARFLTRREEVAFNAKAREHEAKHGRRPAMPQPPTDRSNRKKVEAYEEAYAEYDVKVEAWQEAQCPELCELIADRICGWKNMPPGAKEDQPFTREALIEVLMDLPYDHVSRVYSAAVQAVAVTVDRLGKFGWESGSPAESGAETASPIPVL